MYFYLNLQMQMCKAYENEHTYMCILDVLFPLV